MIFRFPFPPLPLIQFFIDVFLLELGKPIHLQI
jgi:hypothetical protein